jgi:hypothetical protein
LEPDARFPAIGHPPLFSAPILHIFFLSVNGKIIVFVKFYVNKTHPVCGLFRAGTWAPDGRTGEDGKPFYEIPPWLQWTFPMVWRTAPEESHLARTF